MLVGPDNGQNEEFKRVDTFTWVRFKFIGNTGETRSCGKGKLGNVRN